MKSLWSRLMGSDWTARACDTPTRMWPAVVSGRASNSRLAPSAAGPEESAGEKWGHELDPRRVSGKNGKVGWGIRSMIVLNSISACPVSLFRIMNKPVSQNFFRSADANCTRGACVFAELGKVRSWPYSVRKKQSQGLANRRFSDSVPIHIPGRS